MALALIAVPAGPSEVRQGAVGVPLPVSRHYVIDRATGLTAIGARIASEDIDESLFLVVVPEPAVGEAPQIAYLRDHGVVWDRRAHESPRSSSAAVGKCIVHAADERPVAVDVHAIVQQHPDDPGFADHLPTDTASQERGAWEDLPEGEPANRLGGVVALAPLDGVRDRVLEFEIACSTISPCSLGTSASLTASRSAVYRPSGDL